ncbi:hypothetical protein WJX79_007832 [Trebouxia sp. C0005]
MAESDAAKSRSGQGRTAVVSGGGPVGAVTAILLADQGWNVQVYDQASLPSVRPAQQDNRAYRLTVSSRGLRVLKLANDPQCVRAFRDELALRTVQEAQRLFPEAIKFHYKTAVTKVDFKRQLVHLSRDGSNTTEVGYDLLVGADGAGSVVRSALQHIMPDNYIRRYRHKQVYSMTQVTPSDPAKIPAHAVFQAHPIKDGAVLWDGRSSKDCRVGLSVPQELADAIRQGRTDKIVAVLQSGGPSLPDYARKAVIELAQSKPDFYPMPSWTHLSQLHGPRTVLLGDAAHTMSPVLGQGLNAGLEDAAVFADCLQQHRGNVNTALLAYNTRRLPDVQAIMTVNEVVASSDIGLSAQDQDEAHKLWLSGHKMLLILHMASSTMLHKGIDNSEGITKHHYNLPDH